MANEEQLAVLRQGAEAWNQWRAAHPETAADLRGAQVHLVNLSKADLRKVNFCKADLREAHFSGVYLGDADLRGSVLSWAEFKNADLSNADLSETELSNADLSSANLSGANLQRANLQRANLQKANLSETNFSKANLSKALLVEAFLVGANLYEANLSQAELHRSFLSRTDLRGATLRQADLRWSDLNGANLFETKFQNAILGWTSIGNVDLSTAQDLESIKHKGPSTIGIDTIYRSRGKIPELFLRRAGVPNRFITYMQSLTNEVIQYYSCFISHSHLDQAFADRLYNDLQGKSVRCWYAPEDMKIGDKFRQRIDQAIRVHDKLLLVLSAQSVASRWVEREVEAVFEQEDQQGRQVLFPIRIDDAIIETDQAWASTIRRERHIGDFSQWREHDAYQQAFTRLLRDLKASES